MAKRARQSFAYSAGEVILVISEDAEYDDDHPYVKAHPDMFIDILDNPHRIRTPVVEQATAAPGEVRRGPGRPRKDT
jgi:hypothetical protein